MTPPIPQAAPSTSASTPGKVDGGLFALLALVVLINLPYLNGEFLPAHDAKFAFSMFSYFYNHVAIEHDLPLWMVYGTYGMPSALYQFSYLSTGSYLFMAVGSVLGIQNSLLLFTLSLIGEQLVFALGVYLLSRRLFSDRMTVFLVCIGAVCGTVWYWQLYFNFRTLMALPLALHFLFRFVSEKRPEFFWITGGIALLGILGCPPYFYSLQALVLVLAAAGLGSGFWRALRCLAERSWANGLAFGVLTLVVSVIALMLIHALSGIRIDTPNRDPVSGRIALSTFLTYGGTATTQTLAGFVGMVPRFEWGAERELTHYFGLLPLVALPVALLRCRTPEFISLAVAAAGVLLLSLGGTFACLAYRIPLLNLFRHLGYVTPVAKILLLLASGFGLDRILAALSSGLTWDRRTRFGTLAVILLFLWLVLDLQVGGENMVAIFKAMEVGDFRSPTLMGAMTLGIRVIVYLGVAAVVLWPSRSAPTASAWDVPLARKALLIALLTDGLLFQSQMIARMPRTSEPNVFPIAALPYRERRGEALDASTEQRIQDWRASGAGGTEYHTVISFAFRLDPAQPLGRPDGLANDRVSALKECRWRRQPDPALSAVLGVSAPKLRLVSEAIYVDSDAEARKAVTESSMLDTVPVLRNVPKELQFGKPGDSGQAKGAIVVKEFSANRLAAEVDVAQEKPVWLTYADAAHPSWQATVNGHAVPIVEACLAFKAVRLESGRNTVEFAFRGGVSSLAQRSLALICALLALGAFVGLVATLVPGWRPSWARSGTPSSFPET
jgi:hypothetical protein